MTTGIRILKFGGTSVGSAEAVRAATDIVAGLAPRVGVVVSASAGTTDLLIDAARSALDGNRERAEMLANEFEERHHRLVRELIVDSARANDLDAWIGHAAHELRAMCESISILRELTPRSQDAIVARGERAMARIFEAFLEQRGVKACYIDAADIIHAERRNSSVLPDLVASEEAARNKILPRIDDGFTVVLPGFIGRGPKGAVITLGRGGSDFSAAIIARSVHAESLTLYKEVHGLMTADPRYVTSARVIPELHYREAAELAYYGAKVLHPRTMIPLVDRAIPLFVKNTFDPGFPGTRIAASVTTGAYPVKALTAIPGQALISIEGSGMLGVPGIAARTFTALAAGGHSVSMISQASSEASICFVVPQEEAADCCRALREAFEPEITRRLVDDVRATEGLALLAVVGLGMQGTPGIAARTFTAISREGINVVAVAQGSSELNITIVIEAHAVPRALNALHDEFQLSKLRPLASSEGREATLAILGLGRIGRTLVRQLIDQETFLRNERGVRILGNAIADRSGVVIEEHGFDSSALEEMLERKEKTGRVGVDAGSHAPGNLSSLADQMRSSLWTLPSYRPVLVDVTAEETAPLLLDALRNRVHLVLANKKPLAIKQVDYDELFGTARANGLQIRYEATVGAGLPILDTFAKLQESGDSVISVIGCLSGTLGYLMTRLEDGALYSAAVHEAWSLGYTEPDPREDLSGMDVARKALILARTLGIRIEPGDIAVEPLFPRAASDPDPATFIGKLAPFDDEYRARIDSARSRGAVLRYIARIEPDRVSVGIEEVPESSPAGRLRGTDNQIVIRTKRYDANPLVVIGPGAGAEVTAAGVLNDIVAIAINQERRTSSSSIGARES